MSAAAASPQALAVVGLSARAMAEGARRDGHAVVAVDAFGDLDTRRAARRWLPAARPGRVELDASLVLEALRGLARAGDVAGWVPGGGCEGQPALLQAGAQVLPLIGTAPQAVARVRDPLAFFGFLAAHGIAHPEVRSGAPADAAGWLLKDALACGGGHIRSAAAGTGAVPSPHHYHQRRVAGQPMSATFVANGQAATLLGINELLVHPHGDRPYVYSGAIGPVPLPGDALRQVERALRLLAGGFALQGLGSLDFMLDGDEVLVLEVNPRPPATLALYAGAMAAHVQACQRGRLPQPAPAAGGRVHGHRTVWSPRALKLDASTAAWLHALPGCHDLPAAGVPCDSGAPLCTLSASGDGAAQVRARLDSAHEELCSALESLP